MSMMIRKKVSRRRPSFRLGVDEDIYRRVTTGILSDSLDLGLLGPVETAGQDSTK